MYSRLLSGVLLVSICPLLFGVGNSRVNVDNFFDKVDSELSRCPVFGELSTYDNTSNLLSLHKQECITSIANHMLELFDSEYPAIATDVHAVLKSAHLHYKKQRPRDSEFCFEVRQIDLGKGETEWTTYVSCMGNLQGPSRRDVCGTLTRACLDSREASPFQISIRYSFENISQLTLTLRFNNGNASYVYLGFLSDRVGRGLSIHRNFGQLR